LKDAFVQWIASRELNNRMLSPQRAAMWFVPRWSMVNA
jgi:hypothetical protein